MEEPTKSQFNAGIAQAQEIREHQNLLNKAKISLLSISMDPEYPSIYNFELCLKILNNLFKEVEPKCSSTEKDNLYKLKNVSESFLDRHPIVKRINGRTVIDNNSLKVFKKILETYEEAVRKSIDDHNFNSPSKSDLRRAITET